MRELPCCPLPACPSRGNSAGKTSAWAARYVSISHRANGLLGCCGAQFPTCASHRREFGCRRGRNTAPAQRVASVRLLLDAEKYAIDVGLDERACHLDGRSSPSAPRSARPGSPTMRSHERLNLRHRSSGALGSSGSVEDGRTPSTLGVTEPVRKSIGDHAVAESALHTKVVGLAQWSVGSIDGVGTQRTAWPLAPGTRGRRQSRPRW